LGGCGSALRGAWDLQKSGKRRLRCRQSHRACSSNSDTMHTTTPRHPTWVQLLRFLASKCAWLDGNDAEDDTPLHLAARCALLGGGLLAACIGDGGLHLGCSGSRMLHPSLLTITASLQAPHPPTRPPNHHTHPPITPPPPKARLGAGRLPPPVGRRQARSAQQEGADPPGGGCGGGPPGCGEAADSGGGGRGLWGWGRVSGLVGFGGFGGFSC